MKNLLYVSVVASVLLIGLAGPATATTTPIIATATSSSGQVKWAVGKKIYSVRPWGKNYHGKMMAKKVTFGKTMIVLTVAQASGAQPEVKLYTSAGKLLESIRPFYGGNNLGYNASLIVQPKLKRVFIAFGTKKVGASARIMEVTSRGLNQVNNPTVAPTESKGQVLVQFLKVYPNEYGLVTMIADNTATLKVWRYSTRTERFDVFPKTPGNRWGGNSGTVHEVFWGRDKPID